MFKTYKTLEFGDHIWDLIQISTNMLSIDLEICEAGFGIESFMKTLSSYHCSRVLKSRIRLELLNACMSIIANDVRNIDVLIL